MSFTHLASFNHFKMPLMENLVNRAVRGHVV